MATGRCCSRSKLASKHKQAYMQLGRARAAFRESSFIVLRVGEHEAYAQPSAGDEKPAGWKQYNVRLLGTCRKTAV